MFHAKLCVRKVNFQGNYEGELLNEPSQTNFECIRASNENDQSEVLCVLLEKLPFYKWKTFSCVFSAGLFTSMNCLWNMYLHHRKSRCRLTGRSGRKSHWVSPHIDRCSDRGNRSCCSGPGSQAARLGWSSLAPPGPAWHHWAAENGCIPGSLFAWMQFLLQTATQTEHSIKKKSWMIRTN